jgi:hypothetical protein
MTVRSRYATVRKCIRGGSPLTLFHFTRIQDMSGLVVGIDASRNRSGGAIAHLVGIISEGNPLSYGIREVHVWSYKKLLNALPDQQWLVKHNPSELERPLIYQVWWQFRTLSRAAREAKCNLLFATDESGYVVL